MIALIDNYDSFTYNLYHYLSSKEKVVIIKNDQISKNFSRIIKSKGIVISPGPSTPFNSGECLIACLLDQILILVARNNISIDTPFCAQIIHDSRQQLTLCHRLALLWMNAGDG